MTALEYMEKQIQQHRISHIQAVDRNAPEEMLENIRRKIGYYEKAVEALLVAEVVRCKDCKYWHDFDGFMNCRSINGLDTAWADDFCSNGVRKDNE